jgi:drug/metabolite transporter (DMT)-like permease
MIVWGFAWPSAKYLTQFAGPIEISFIRFILTAISIFILLKWMKVSRTISKAGIKFLLLGTAVITIYNLFFFEGLKQGTPGAGGVLVTTMTPLISYILLMIIKRKSVSIIEWVGLGIGVVAGAFLLHIWTDIGNIFKGGNLFFLCSCLTWAILSRITANASQYGSPLAFTWWMYVLCPIVLAAFTNFSSIYNLVTIAPNYFWLNLIFNAVINTGIATTVFFYATSKMGAAHTSSYIYIVPFSAAISSFLIVNENIHWNTIVGGALGILAVYVLNKGKAKG